MTCNACRQWYIRFQPFSVALISSGSSLGGSGAQAAGTKRGTGSCTESGMNVGCGGRGNAHYAAVEEDGMAKAINGEMQTSVDGGEANAWQSVYTPGANDTGSRHLPTGCQCGCITPRQDASRAESYCATPRNLRQANIELTRCLTEFSESQHLGYRYVCHSSHACPATSQNLH